MGRRIVRMGSRLGAAAGTNFPNGNLSCFCPWALIGSCHLMRVGRLPKDQPLSSLRDFGYYVLDDRCGGGCRLVLVDLACVIRAPSRSPALAGSTPIDRWRSGCYRYPAIEGGSRAGEQRGVRSSQRARSPRHGGLDSPAETRPVAARRASRSRQRSGDWPRA